MGQIGIVALNFTPFAKKMNLPQTATLSIHANAMSDDERQGGGFVKLPFDLGYTWFEEMDYYLLEYLNF